MNSRAPGAERFDDLPTGGVAAEEDDRGPGRAASREPRQLEAAHARHPDIQQGDRRLRLLDLGDSASCPSFARATTLIPWLARYLETAARMLG